MPQLRTAYRQRLKKIDAAMQQTISMVEHDILSAGRALLDSDEKAADVVEANHELVEDSYEKFERLVVDQFARQTPVAGELRFLLAVFRIVPELTGAHARTAEIARRSVTGLAELPDRLRGLISQLISADAQMWGLVGTVYLSGSAEIADDIKAADSEVHELHARLLAELASTDLRRPVLLEMGMIARLLERVGDHAVATTRHIDHYIHRPGSRKARPNSSTEQSDGFPNEKTQGAAPVGEGDS